MANEDLPLIIDNGNRDLDPNYEIIQQSGVKRYLELIRPSWKSKNLVQRTLRILPQDPSSACQRIFNASIFDLREKIVMAGIDIAQEAADLYKLPKVLSEDDILENYNVSKLITLAYRMGLLTKPEYRRVSRVYDIRKDLEHEDDEYEAGVGDVVYIFQTCIEVILANDPVQIIKLTEIKEIVEAPKAITLDKAVIEDYAQAPDPRQLEIYQFLISSSLDSSHPDIVRQNCYNALGTLSKHTRRKTILDAAQTFVDKRLGRRTPLHAEMRVAFVSEILPYLRRAHVDAYYESYYQKLRNIGYHWTSSNSHGELLRDLKESGGISHCKNPEIKDQIMSWLIGCYIGESGGYGFHGRNRKVFYSNAGAPLAYEIIQEDSSLTYDDIDRFKSWDEHKNNLADKYVQRRFHDLLELYGLSED